MIYTVTLNPSIDYVVQVSSFDLGTINRAEKDMKFPGGKGINVSRVLQRLGVKNIALGFTGGFTGQFIKEVLQTEGVTTNFVQVDEDTRINVKIKGEEETELNGQGPIVTKEQFEQLMKKLRVCNLEIVLYLLGVYQFLFQVPFTNQLLRLELKRYSCSSRCKWKCTATCN